MEIKNKTIVDMIFFKEIQRADIFKFNNEIFVKTANCRINNNSFNAVSLERGIFSGFAPNTKVELVSYEFTLK